ncbi:hypothetical protein CAPTEDRAFT_198910 [Capitella teleta]|uniref:U1-type domain-containing protein n=1 Tax=Capitella teleta TaxID=283909 RepID=R7U6N7_CAPTE|nr:hypothetical protein CAPTEDRAFT_198910 [Capitella teleta]|eukprot:ELU01659.1 hypothetical protein CAPTEDRAFT_198910 [Capitella teleta]
MGPSCELPAVWQYVSFGSSTPLISKRYQSALLRDSTRRTPSSPVPNQRLTGPSLHLISGYQGYQGNPQTLSAPLAATAPTGVGLAPGGQLSTAAAMNFTPSQLQQLASMPTDLNGSMLTAPSLDANLNYVLPTTTTLRSPNGPCRSGLKRKLCAADGESSSESTECNDVDSHNVTLHPLYCKVCRVTLNAPAQAKQHYEGKTHAKKAKLYADALEAEKLTPACALKTSASSQEALKNPFEPSGPKPQL